MRIKLIFLGTGTGQPTLMRNTQAIALQIDQTSEYLLFDCGEATQHRLLACSISLAKIRHIFITHLHGDHVFGLFGLLASRNLNRIESALNIYAPPGVKELITRVFKSTDTNIAYPLNIHELSPHEEVQTTDFKITVIPLEHDIISYAYLLATPDKPGAFKVKKALADKLPPGPLYSQLQRGNDVEYDNKLYKASNYTGAIKKGMQIIICGDNKNPELLTPYLANTQLLVHETTVDSSHAPPPNFFHSTAASVAKVAQAAVVPNLILNHISPRYLVSPPANKKNMALSTLANEIEENYDYRWYIANDGDCFCLENKKELRLTSNKLTKKLK